MLGGHSEIGPYAILGAVSGVQQRCRVGAHAFVGGLTGATRDIVPFVMATGRWARLGGINVVGLSRRGFSREAIHQLRAAYELFFTSSGSRPERLALLTEQFAGVPAVEELVAFIRASGNRPLALPRRADDARFGDSEGGSYQDGDDG
jgi:UDP-N-acetylglucosamine acyltransferase